MMVAVLALEGGAILALASGALLIWRTPLLTGWVDVLTLVAAAGGLSICCLAAFHYADLYSLQVVRSFDALLRRIPRVLAAAVFLVALVSLLVPATRITDNPLESGLLFAIGVIFGPVLPLRAVAYRLIRSRRFGERMLVVGMSPLVHAVIGEIDWRPDLRYTVVGMVENTENLGRLIEASRPDRIIVAFPERQQGLPIYKLVESIAHGIVVEDVAETYERLTGKLPLEALSPSNVIFSRAFRASRRHRVLARTLSLAVSAVGLLALAPVLSLIALLIKLDSRNSVFFIQERVGLGGQPFKLIKFCTMHPVSRPTSEWEQDNRHRITRLGRWLRRFRLDELPQLVNVLRGDMNLVGPRPHPVTNLEVMILAARNLSEMSAQAIPYYAIRCSVRPGMTGWAQVRYAYANTLEEEMEKVRYDLYYIKHGSLWLDLRILVETLKTIVCRDETASPSRVDDADRQVSVTRKPQPGVWAREPAALNGSQGSDRPQSGGPADARVPGGSALTQGPNVVTLRP